MSQDHSLGHAGLDNGMGAGHARRGLSMLCYRADPPVVFQQGLIRFACQACLFIQEI